MGDSKIEWTDATWNPLAGCTRASPGCDNCYAAVMALRLEEMAKADIKVGRNPGAKAKYISTAVRTPSGRVAFNGTINLDLAALDEPLRWRRPRRVFVNSMSDLFHQDVPDEFIAQVFSVKARNDSPHTYQVLTKRPERAAEWFAELHTWQGWVLYGDTRPPGYGGNAIIVGATDNWPAKNIWIGTSVEDQQRANERIPHLLNIPARIRFLSCEPLLGPVDICRWLPCPRGGPDCCGNRPPTCCQCDIGRTSNNAISWAIVGGESGHHARPMHPAWVRSLRDQCQSAGVAFHFKQHGEWISPVDYDQPIRDTRDYQWHSFHDGDEAYTSVIRAGKHAAGRLLDGREWNEFPE